MAITARLIEVRTGKAKKLGQGTLVSAIDKDVQVGPVQVRRLGLEGDEQADRNFHGGFDKAVLHYAAENYDIWLAESPSRLELYQPGAFGENFVSRGFSATNVCVGDVFQIGSAVLEVSQPRQPCFKLNHRFLHPSMARRVQETGRTGWYYRVLKEGSVAAGDEIRLLGRPNPEWTLRRIQHYLYEERLDIRASQALSSLPALSESLKKLFIARLQNASTEQWEARLIGIDDAASIVGDEDRKNWRIVQVSNIIELTPRVRSLQLVDPSGRPLERFSPGAHISIELASGLVRQYSLCGSLFADMYEIAVALAPDSRGGSQSIHRDLKVGDLLSISPPRNRFSLAEMVGKHVMIAGGIGITPFLTMIEACNRDGRKFELHYCVRTPADAAFRDDLEPLPNESVKFHYSRVPGGHRLDCEKLLRELPATAHVYCCGPESLMTAVREASPNWDFGRVHFERFTVVAGTNSDFQVKIASNGVVLKVGADSTILDTLRQAGFDVASSCETGSCGTCRVGVLSGAVDHRDVILSASERKSQLTTCVSRAHEGIITLDL
jgi:MOSC domain-containing protein YiiM/ferredoxin-NADP reductase